MPAIRIRRRGIGSKEALLIQALGESCRRWIAELQRAASPGDGESDGLQAVDALAVFDANRGLCVAFVEALAAAQHSDVLRGQLAQIYRDLRSALAALLGSADARVDAAAQATAAIALVDGLMIQWLLEPEDLPSSDRIRRGLGALGT